MARFLDRFPLPTRGWQEIQGNTMKRALITVVALGLAMSSFSVCLAGLF
ncbi:MAG: hypothetical protein ABI132_02535 [Rhodanobacteraceae bacterium]